MSGSVVCLHTSLRSFGHLRGGAAALIDGFLNEECTILVPTFSDDFSVPPPIHIRPTGNGWTYKRNYDPGPGANRVFSPDSNEVTVEEMGVVPAEVLKRANRVRGSHPLCSFTAVGNQAETLIRCQTASHVFAPLYALSEFNGLVVLIGVGLEKMTLLHAAEEMSGRKPFVRWANDSSGVPIGVAMGGCSYGFGKLEPSLSSLSQQIRVGMSLWSVYSARETLIAAANIIRSNPRITHCEDTGCERCPDAVAGGPA